MKSIYYILLSAWILSALVLQTALAAPSIALGYTPKYPPDFSHFKYVNPDAPKGGELTIGALGNFDRLNPFLTKGISAAEMEELTIETLMIRSLDEPYSLYAGLAEDIELAEDKLSVTFRLHAQARFADNSPVNADDVIFTFNTLNSEIAHPQYRTLWRDIQRAEKIDQKTIRFHFSKPNPEIHLIIAQLPVFSEKSTESESFDKLVIKPLITSGAYQVKDFKLGRYITYQRNPHYWGNTLNTRRGFYNFDTITVKYYGDLVIMTEAFKAKEIDFMVVYSAKSWARDFETDIFKTGQAIKTLLPHRNNVGMQAFIFNLRKPLFQDKKVRQAINLAYDYDWANRNLFYGQYDRCNSYFSNSDLAATGEPTPAEITLLEPFRAELPTEIFTTIWQPPQSPDYKALRNNLKKARDLLESAGWRLNAADILEKEGMRLEFEVLLSQDGFERILDPFAHNLKKLGIILKMRRVDQALYQRRVDNHQFDMVVHLFPQSQSPGNQLKNFWHSHTADQIGSLNIMGLKNPVVDYLLEKIIYAPNRADLEIALRALDRVMLVGEYLVPNWYIGSFRVVYWHKLDKPTQEPLYYQAQRWAYETWWQRP